MTSAAEPTRSILLFDGVCNLCTASVRFVIKNDSKCCFRFASLQSPVAEKLLGAELQQHHRLDSVILVLDDKIYRKSAAVIHTARRLDGFWPLLAVLLIIPRPLRDAVYDFIGMVRYRIFGKRRVCWRPDDNFGERFLDYDAPLPAVIETDQT